MPRIANWLYDRMSAKDRDEYDLFEERLVRAIEALEEGVARTIPMPSIPAEAVRALLHDFFLIRYSAEVFFCKEGTRSYAQIKVFRK